MKVFSILFQSVISPSRIVLFTSVVDTAEEAHKQATEMIIKEHGDLMWKPTIANYLDIIITPETKIEPKLQETVNKDMAIMETNDIKRQTENWLMSIIIRNKDSALFEASKTYLSDPEKLFIEEKIK